MANKTTLTRRQAEGFVDWLAIVVASGLGCGYFPVAPGTVGTLLAVPVYLVLVDYAQSGLITYVSVVVLLIVVGSIAAHRAGPLFGAVDSGKIVIDEVAGFLVTMTLAPPGWWALATGFLLFRVYDILKPWPCTYFDRQVANGFGVVMDDIIAGIYAFLSLQLLHRLNLF